MKIGITERGDAALDKSWMKKVDQVDGMILITKAPQKLDFIPTHSVVHCTITGLGPKLEPNVNTGAALDAYHQLTRKFGGERIVLRIDPIIPTPKGMQAALRILEHREGRVRISFIDAYPHVRARFKKAGLPNLPWSGLHAPLDVRLRYIEQIKEVYFNVEICAEPGITCLGCVSVRDMLALKLDGELTGKSQQRADCMCAAEKVELLATPKRCAHQCEYCYWKD